MGLKYVKQIFNCMQYNNLHALLQPMKVWSWRTLLLNPLKQNFKQTNDLQKK
jgi:muconolactone delta-isomerase